MTLQQEIMKALNVKSEIQPQAEIQERVGFLKEYLKFSHAKGYVLGISGGQDSTLAGRLAQLAIEELRQEGYDAAFTAVRLPYGVQHDEEDAQRALQFIQPDHALTFNIKASVDEMTKSFTEATGKTLSDFNKGNIKARERMIAQYSVGADRQLLVIGTDHAAEAVTGFYTKHGDGAADILPLSGLTKRQGKELLKELDCPKELYEKKPTADLLDDKPQQEDETELGFTYVNIDDYLEGKPVPEEFKRKIEERYIRSAHKRTMPVSPADNWWRE